MVKVSQLIGGAGTGKTAKLLSLMDYGMKRWGDPFRIGFVTFTRSARREASTRAADRYNLRPDDLETRGLIRTLHSICYQALGVKDELITGSAESRKWLQEALQDAAVAPSGDLEDEYSSLGFYDGEAKSDAAMTLQLWSAARNRIVPFREVWKEAWTCEFRLPDLEKCRQIVEQYEDQKALFSRLDFVDLLAHFAGYKFFFDGPERRPPDGQVPDAPMWLFDEQQDASPLLHAVCQRLIDSAVWAYVAADPGQAIYGWAGADPALFMWGWDYHQTQVMRQSWRCPQEILDLGENLLRGTDGFFDRHVAGRDRKDGEKKTVDNRKDAQFGGGQKLSIRGDGSEHPISPFSRIETAQTTELASLVSPHDDWLVLARTNWLANAVCRRLDAAGIPYQTLRGGNKWHAPERFKAVTALMDAASGRSINGAQWRGVLKHVPSKSDGEDLLVRGTKTFWADRTNEVAAKHAPAVLLDNFLDLGATAKAVQQLRDGRWRNWFAGAREMAEAIDRWGARAVESSGIRVGTIHAAKGREAQNVAVILPVPRQVEMGRRTKAGADEAQRVAYVAVTRASERVVLLDDPKQRYRMEIP